MLTEKNILYGMKLANLAGQHVDEHGTWKRGDHITEIKILDVVKWPGSKAYHDNGHAGLALIKVERKRVYPRSSKWYPSYTHTNFLVGKNESGDYFSHSVNMNLRSVKGAYNWIWDNRKVIQRQGDIALVKNLHYKSPKIPKYLPSRHIIEGDFIIHPQHPILPMPREYQSIIIGKRAFVRASSETCD